MIKKVFALIICTTFLLSCTGKRERYINLRPLTLGFVDSIPYAVKQKKQLYDSLGLTLNLTVYATPTDRDSALYNGMIDGSVIDYIDAITLHSKGFPIRIVADADTAYYLIAGIGSDIRTVEQLRGRNMAVSRNTAIDYITDRLLQQAGIPPNEVNKAEIRKSSLRLDLLQNGLVDAAVLAQPYATEAIENGNRLLLSTSELDIPVTGIVFTDMALRDKQKEIEAYLREIDNPTLPPPSKLKQTIDWLKEKKIVSGSYAGTHLTDTINGVKLK